MDVLRPPVLVGCIQLKYRLFSLLSPSRACALCATVAFVGSAHSPNVFSVDQPSTVESGCDATTCLLTSEGGSESLTNTGLRLNWSRLNLNLNLLKHRQTLVMLSITHHYPLDKS